MVDQSKCDWKCSGDHSLVCGALWRMNVFETASPPLSWETATTSVDIEDEHSALLCEVTFSFALDHGVVLKDLKANGCTSGTSSYGTLKFAGRHLFKIASSQGINLECSGSAVLVDGALDASILNRTLTCSALDDQCLTDSGEVFPSKCVFPFVHNGRKFQACTDAGSPDPTRLWCPTEVGDSGFAVEGTSGLCNSKCGYCAGSPVDDSVARASSSCGYDCLINPHKVMEPLNLAEMDPSLLTSPTVTENAKEPLASSNKLGHDQFKFDIGQPGVFLSCANGFNRFPCFQDIFVNCTGSYVFAAYSADAATSSINIRIETTDVKNTHFGCRPCPYGFNYKKGYESRTFATNLGDYSSIKNIRDCKELCDRVGCLSLIYSPSSMKCKLHSTRVNSPTMSTYKDYQVCVKEEATQTRKRKCNGSTCKGAPHCISNRCEKKNENDPEETGICQECKINGNKGCETRQRSACEKPSNGGLNQCRGCLNPTECSHIPGGYTACNMAANPHPQCAKCDPASDTGCKDNDVNKYCVNDVGPIVGVDTKCVECKTSADCHDATRSQCSAQNTCVPCQNDRPDCNNIPGKPVCEPNAGRCVACRADADCPDESPAIDAAYRFCKNDNTCGYQAFVKCSVYWYGAVNPNDKRDPGPELSIRIFPSANANNNNCLKQCKYHHKKSLSNGRAEMGSRNCPYNTIHADFIPGSHNSLPDVKVAKKCYRKDITLKNEVVKDLLSTMIWGKVQFKAQFQNGKSGESAKFRITDVHEELVKTTDIVDCRD